MEDSFIQVFLNKSFLKLFKKSDIDNENFNTAINEVLDGKSISLGNKLHKVRIGTSTKGKRGAYRAIFYFRIKKIVIFVYLFPKNKKDNLTKDGLKAFKLVAKEYTKLTEKDIDKLVKLKEFKRWNDAKP